VTGDPDKPWNQGVPEERRQAARALFLEGNRMFWILPVRAVEKYEAALRIWRHPGFYFNLAVAQINLGREVEARENIENALVHGKKSLGTDLSRELQKQLHEVKRRLGRISVTCDTPEAEVALDGVPLFTGPGSRQVWVKAKVHEITAKKAGYLSESKRVNISGGQLQEVQLRLLTLSQATDARRRWLVWKPWAVVAAGGLVVTGSGVLHTLAARNFNSYDEGFLQLPCVKMPNPEAPGCTAAEIGPVLNNRLHRAQFQQSIAIGGYIAGGVLVATGVLLLYLNRPGLAEEGIDPSNGGITVSPAVSADMIGFTVRIAR
jgi:hypothetical protein